MKIFASGVCCAIIVTRDKWIFSQIGKTCCVVIISLFIWLIAEHFVSFLESQVSESPILWSEGQKFGVH